MPLIQHPITGHWFLRIIIPVRGRKLPCQERLIKQSAEKFKNHNPRKGTETLCERLTIMVKTTYVLRIIIPVRGRKQAYCSHAIESNAPNFKNHNPRKGTETSHSISVTRLATSEFLRIIIPVRGRKRLKLLG